MNRTNQTDDTSCKSRSILEILLAVGIIDIIQGSLITIGMCFSIMAAYRQNAFTSNLERCFSFIRSMAGLSTFVLAIVLSVFVWGSNCNTVKNGRSFNNSLIYRNLHNGQSIPHRLLGCGCFVDCVQYCIRMLCCMLWSCSSSSVCRNCIKKTYLFCICFYFFSNCICHLC
jgi:hypothetical protein